MNSGGPHLDFEMWETKNLNRQPVAHSLNPHQDRTHHPCDVFVLAAAKEQPQKTRKNAPFMAIFTKKVHPWPDDLHEYLSS
jgi:hypothetical protein